MPVVGSGILSWSVFERLGGRYGTIFLSPSDFLERVHHPVMLDTDALHALEGESVRLAVRVLECRSSGHAGDSLLYLVPGPPPAPGSVHELGAGPLFLEDQREIPVAEHPTGLGIGIRPSDGRTEMWMDPRVLYRVHDQTVELLIDRTTAPETPPSPLLPGAGDDAPAG
ncbi:hypothetical protein [Longimicrobium terrae]|uniref:Uncharacterized protein n=1 Tax=Longimicrobium terrae TaxID=1639882 RepID=A0A841GX65_9BACT|nr:hypothetical protein [Longimicrobium terrae]MBB4635939.1 hypothetical protein [Longimicrobium terrae]MBB6070335.1 hypothetical protein [Longimicrobium terrae]NNC30835.1 hypothetical protein [Longimicrobium terrae]